MCKSNKTHLNMAINRLTSRMLVRSMYTTINKTTMAFFSGQRSISPDLHSVSFDVHVPASSEGSFPAKWHYFFKTTINPGSNFKIVTSNIINALYKHLERSREREREVKRERGQERERKRATVWKDRDQQQIIWNNSIFITIIHYDEHFHAILLQT